MLMSPTGSGGFYSNHGGTGMVGPGYGYTDVGGPGAAYGYYGNGVGAVEQWQWTASMTRAYCAPPEHAMPSQVLGCGGQGGTTRYGAMDVTPYLPQSGVSVRQLTELSDSDIDDRKDWYRFHAL